MKKNISLVILLFLCSANTFAQFNLGLKAGINYSMISAREGQFDYKGLLGYQGGVWARFGKSIYFQPEVYVGTKNTDLKFTQINTTIKQDGEIKLTTVDVPLLFGKQIGIEKLNFHFVVGPSLQFILQENNTVFNQVTDPNFYNYRPFVANLQAGGGVDLGNLSIDLRYETGLQDINKSNGQHNNLIHFSLGYKLL
ncbi:MAG: PorT family protein [Sphingobacteriales bacterium]|nr:MAG: PorT family protein [Sphingobacteriales bacterium]